MSIPAQVLTFPKVERDTKRQRHRGVYERVPGSGIWWVRYADSTGQLRREKAGSKSAAIKLYTKRKQQALEGWKLPETLRQTITFAQIAEAAIQDIQRRYSRPADDVARLRAAMKRFGSREAATVKPSEIEDWLTSQGWADATINHHRTVISIAYRLAIRDGKLQTNPARAVAHRKEKNERVRWLTAEEEAKLRAAIRKHCPAHEPEFDFALHTGLRQGNQYGLTWEMVDWNNRELHIPATKNGEPIDVPLNDTALGILRSIGQGVGRVFLSAETGKPLQNSKHWFTAAVRAAGLSDFHWHDLRHCFATRLRHKGVALEDIALLLGHKGLKMTQRYAHPSRERLHQHVGQLSK